MTVTSIRSQARRVNAARKKAAGNHAKGVTAFKVKAVVFRSPKPRRITIKT